MPKSNILHLVLKGHWFDMINSGEKLEEYREIKSHYIKRLCWTKYRKWSRARIIKDFENGKDILRTDIGFLNGQLGYASDAKTFLKPVKQITIATGHSKWGAEEGELYFVIRLMKKK